MILPFVRELFADVEKTAAFARALAALKSTREGVGGGAAGSGVSPGVFRAQLSGLTPTAKALHLVLLHRAAARPLIFVVPNNRAAEEMLPVVQSFAELTGAADPAEVLSLPAHDVLPYEGSSPHPEIQEQQARALWKMATGAAAIVIVPATAAMMRLRGREYYAALARVVRRGESVDLEALTAHLNVVGYARTDTVEMPGEYSVRGGILDVYPPEAERPLRLELFGDEVESIRTFDPATQRSSGSAAEEAELLPLTPTPVSEELLGAIHARLSGQRVSGAGEIVEEAVRAAGVTVFPGWELYAPLYQPTLGLRRSAPSDEDGAPTSEDGAPTTKGTLFDILPRAAVLVDEPATAKREIDHWWERVGEVHERSLVGKLAQPEELYLPPEAWWKLVGELPGGSVEQLTIVASSDPTLALLRSAQSGEGGAPRGEAGPAGEVISFLSQPTTRFHGSVPALVEEINKLTGESRRVMVCAGSAGEVERLADVFSEYNVPFRLGSRAPRPGEVQVEETSYFTGELATTTLVRGFVPDGVALPEAGLVIFGSGDLFDEAETAVRVQPARPKSRVSTFLSDFRYLAVGDFVVHVEHGIGEYHGLKEIRQADDSAAEFMILEYAEGARLYVPLTRLDLVQKYRSAEGARPALSRLGTQQWAKTKARVKKAMQDMADELLKLYAARKTAQGHVFPVDTEWQR